MPNWVKTRIIGADMEALKKALLSTDKNGDVYVDFNKVTPMPTDLLNVSAPSVYCVRSKLFSSDVRAEKIIKQQPVTMALKQAFGKFYKKNSKPTQAEFVELVKNNKSIVQEMYRIGNFDKGFEDSDFLTYVEEMAKGFYNSEMYGFTDWYEWSIYNWGTKWNASETVLVDETGIYFDTAWSLAYPIMLELAKITPIRVCFADEDIGHNCGMIDFFLNEDGEFETEEIMGESAELASEVWGYGTVDVYDEEKNDWIEDETDERYIKAQEKYQATVDKICDLMTVESVIKDRVGV